MVPVVERVLGPHSRSGSGGWRFLGPLGTRGITVTAFILFLLAPVLGCEAPSPPEGTDAPEYTAVGQATVIWDGELLRAPFDILPLGSDALLILDADALFAIPRGGGDPRRIGGRGEGPGEFVSVTGGGVTPDGGLVIVDARLRRATFLDPAGGYLHSHSLGAPPELNVATQGPILPLPDGHLGLRWEFGLVDTDGPRAPMGLARHDDSGTPELLAEWEGLEWTDTPWAPMPSGPAGHSPPFAISAARSVVYWLNDDTRCIERLLPATGERLAPVCPPFPSVPIEPYVPSEAEVEEAGVSGLLADVLLGKHGFQDFSGDHPPIQRLLADDQGCLWMRIVKDDAPYDPMIQNLLPATRPSEYEWWVVDPEDGEIAARLLVPERFRPRLVLADTIFGLMEQPDHTLAPATKPFDRKGWEHCRP